MSDPDHRRKMISLRLSEAQYELLKTHYGAYGACNVSDLTRLALRRLLDGSDGSQDALAAKVAALDDRIHTLESRVSLLREREKVIS